MNGPTFTTGGIERRALKSHTQAATSSLTGRAMHQTLLRTVPASDVTYTDVYYTHRSIDHKCPHTALGIIARA